MVIRSSRSRAKGTSSNAQAAEIRRCGTDPAYFIQKYLKVQHPTLGLIPLVARGYQQTFLKCAAQPRSVICRQPRRSGATVIPLALMLWDAVFGEGRTLGAAFLSQHDAVMAMNLLQDWYCMVPTWLRPTVMACSALNLEFDNNCRILLSPASRSFGAGRFFSRVHIDSFAQMLPREQDELWHPLVPSLLTGGTVTITGTPSHRTNQFARIWEDSTLGQNHIVPMMVSPLEVYGPTELLHLRLTMGATQFANEIECEFLP